MSLSKQIETLLSKGTVIAVDGLASYSPPKNGRTYELEELQFAVGGEIEIIGLGEGFSMVLNAMGKFDSSENEGATKIARKMRAIYPEDTIHGNVLVCPARMVE